MHKTLSFRISVALFALLISAAAIAAQDGRVVTETFRSTALAKTVTGESADRSVSVYLPPSYDTSNKRYPVVFLLHGITDTDQTWIRPWRRDDPWQSLPGVMNSGLSENRFGEMIVVMPDANTKWGGSFYTNSSVTGNWEDFIVKELVSYIDQKYRTLAKAESRGITGHSMGGYGAIKLGMKHPDVFSVVYGINPALLDWGADLTLENPSFRFLLTQKPAGPQEVAKGGLYALGTVVVGQAFSPNPNAAPLFFDMPFAIVDGRIRPSEPAFSRWQDNMPVHMVSKYADNLRRLRGIKFDSGYEDEFTHIPVSSRALSKALTVHGIPHVFEEYNGDHRNRMMGRTGRLANEILPYFWMLLDAEGQSKVRATRCC